MLLVASAHCEHFMHTPRCTPVTTYQHTLSGQDIPIVLALYLITPVGWTPQWVRSAHKPDWSGMAGAACSPQQQTVKTVRENPSSWVQSQLHSDTKRRPPLADSKPCNLQRENLPSVPCGWCASHCATRTLWLKSAT
jgi:hypothetical protein